MRIVQVVTLVSPDSAYGGPVRVAVNQLTALSERGHDVRLFSAYRGYASAPSLIEGIDLKSRRAWTLIPRIGFAGLMSPRLMLDLMRAYRRADIVHVHLARDFVTMPAAAMALLMGKKTFIQTHGMVDASDRILAAPLDRIATRNILIRAEKVFYLTPKERSDLGEVAKRDIALEHLVNGVPRSAARVAPSGAKSEVLFLARLHARKRPALFVEAAAALAEEFPGVRFTLVGPDEGEGPVVADRIQELRNPSVAWEGAVGSEGALDRMSSAAVYVLPSVDEPFPMSVLEAASLGLPVIVGRSCGLAPYVSNFDAGVVVDESLESLISAIRLLLEDDALRSSKGANSRRMAQEEFSMDRVASQLEASYLAPDSVAGAP